MKAIGGACCRCRRRLSRLMKTSKRDSGPGASRMKRGKKEASAHTNLFECHDPSHCRRTRLRRYRLCFNAFVALCDNSPRRRLKRFEQEEPPHAVTSGYSDGQSLQCKPAAPCARHLGADISSPACSTASARGCGEMVHRCVPHRQRREREPPGPARRRADGSRKTRRRARDRACSTVAPRRRHATARSPCITPARVRSRGLAASCSSTRCGKLRHLRARK